MAYQIQIRRDTAANFGSSNPVLAQGELALTLDNGKIKIGDGSTAWSSLSYIIGSDIQGLVAGSGITIVNSSGVHVAQLQPSYTTFSSGVLIGKSTASGVTATLGFINNSGTTYFLCEPTGVAEIRFPSASGYAVLATGYTTSTSGILFGTSRSGVYQPRLILQSDLPAIPSTGIAITGVLAGSGITIVSGSGIHVSETQPRLTIFNSGIQVGWSTPTGVAATLAFTNVSGTQLFLCEPTGNSEVRWPSASGYAVLATGYSVITSGVLATTPTSGVYQPRLLADTDLPPHPGNALSTCSGEVQYGIPGVVTSTSTTITHNANTMYYMPFIVDKQITVTQAAVYITLQPGVQASGRMAIYAAHTNWQPSGLVADIGNINTQNAVGTVGISGLSIVLDPGLYLMRLHSDANPAQFGGLRGSPYNGALISDNALNNFATQLRRPQTYQVPESPGLQWNAYTNATTPLLYHMFLKWTPT